MWHRHISGVLMAWAVVGIASAASAQHAPTFADLATHLRAGDGVRVEHRDGTRFSGTVVAVTPDALVLAGPSGRQSFTATTTRRVARVGDSVLNGALFGLLPGFLFGLELPRASSPDSSAPPSAWPSTAPVMARPNSTSPPRRPA
jgi:hypothetical protein